MFDPTRTVSYSLMLIRRARYDGSAYGGGGAKPAPAVNLSLGNTITYDDR